MLNDQRSGLARAILEEALTCDGGHHKQFYLEMLLALNLDIIPDTMLPNPLSAWKDQVEQLWQNPHLETAILHLRAHYNHQWDRGIAP